MGTITYTALRELERSGFVASGTDISASAADNSIDASSTDLAGLLAGQWVLVSGFATADNNGWFQVDVNSVTGKITLVTAPIPDPAFEVPFEDDGDGEVDLSHVGAGSATFTRATVATCRLADGTLKKVASGVPRSHYHPDLSYGGYLREGARTNLFLRSEELDNAAWTKTRCSATADAIAAPDGTLTAEKIVEDATASNTHQVTQAVTATANGNYALTFFVKAAERSWVQLILVNGANFAAKHFNVGSGALGATSMGGTGAVVSASIEAWKDGWYRCELVGSVGSGATAISGTCRLATGDTVVSYTGDGVSGLYVTGTGFEDNVSFASSYIPTTSASATRNRDELTYPISGNVSATVGASYAEIRAARSTNASATQAVIWMADGAGRLLSWQAGQAATTMSMDDGTSVVTKSGITDISTGVRKRASAWGGIEKSVTGDGATVATGAFDGTMGAGGSTNIGIGMNPAAADSAFFGTIKSVRIWQEQLSDVTLQALTAAVAPPEGEGRALVAEAAGPLVSITGYERGEGQEYELEFYSQRLDRSVKTKRTVVQPMDGNPETIFYGRDVFHDVTVIGPNGEPLTEEMMPQWREFLASVEGGESFVLDRYGSIAAPDEPLTVELASDGYSEDRVGPMRLYTLSFRARVLQ